MINQTYKTNSCTLYQNDCFEVMKAIKDNSIDLILTDPPYNNTTGYGKDKFNSDEFWEYMRTISKNNKVFISEQTAPNDFECVWEKEFTRTLDVNKENQIIEFETNKDVLLKATIDEIGNKPIIVWCQFIYEVEKLAKKFNGIGLTSKTKNRDDIIRSFKNNEIKLLFAHPQLIGKGLTFVNCNYNIYYSLSFSYEEFKQSQDRIHRIGQKNKCTYIILQGENTIDSKIYNCLKRKGNAVDELYLEMGLLK